MYSFVLICEKKKKKKKKSVDCVNSVLDLSGIWQLAKYSLVFRFASVTGLRYVNGAFILQKKKCSLCPPSNCESCHDDLVK